MSVSPLGDDADERRRILSKVRDDPNLVFTRDYKVIFLGEVIGRIKPKTGDWDRRYTSFGLFSKFNNLLSLDIDAPTHGLGSDKLRHLHENQFRSLWKVKSDWIRRIRNDLDNQDLRREAVLDLTMRMYEIEDQESLKGLTDSEVDEWTQLEMEYLDLEVKDHLLSIGPKLSTKQKIADVLNRFTSIIRNEYYLIKEKADFHSMFSRWKDQDRYALNAPPVDDYLPEAFEELNDLVYPIYYEWELVSIDFIEAAEKLRTYCLRAFAAHRRREAQELEAKKIQDSNKLIADGLATSAFQMLAVFSEALKRLNVASAETYPSPRFSDARRFNAIIDEYIASKDPRTYSDNMEVWRHDSRLFTLLPFQDRLNKIDSDTDAEDHKEVVDNEVVTSTMLGDLVNHFKKG